MRFPAGTVAKLHFDGVPEAKYHDIDFRKYHEGDIVRVIKEDDLGSARIELVNGGYMHLNGKEVKFVGTSWDFLIPISYDNDVMISEELLI